MADKSTTMAKPGELAWPTLTGSEELTQALIRSAGTGIYILQDGDFLFANTLFQELTGYTEVELRGARLLSFVHPEDREAVRNKAVENLKGKSLLPYEYRFIKKNGDTMWVLERVTSTEYKGRRATVGSFMDITESKNAEKELKTAETAIRTCISAIATADMDGTLTYVNPVFLKIWGYDGPEEVLGRSVASLCKEGEKIQRLMQALLTTRDTEGAEVVAEKKDGTEFIVGLKASLIVDTEGQPVGITASLADITARRQVEETRRQLDRMKSEFTSNVSHELRTPLQSIKGFSKLMLEGKVPDPETQRRFLTAIGKQSEHLSKLIDDLLDVSRLESGLFTIEQQRLSITKPIREAIESLRSLANEKGMVINEHIPDTLPEVRGDEERLMQVMVNLLSNAIKFSSSGGQIAVKAEGKDGELLVQVTDRGTGIAEDALPYLFDRFYRAKTSARAQGTGLGLHISKEIIEAHGGRMRVESKVREGSTFSFSLPLNQHGGDPHE